MKFAQIAKYSLALALSISAGAAFATPTVVWDTSPASGGTVNNDGWSNYASGQRFAERVSFATTTQITGMDIYQYDGNAQAGATVNVTIWADNAGTPGAVLSSFNTALGGVDLIGATGQNARTWADFAAYVMVGGTDYWIGMSSTDQYWTQTSLNGVAGGDGRMAQFNGTDFSFMPGIGDMSFRLRGESGAAAVPEPASMALLGLGLFGIAAMRRRA